jgi:hypothetical protein
MDTCHITPFQLSKRWGLNPKTLQNWRSKGAGPPYLKIGGRVVYRQDDIERYEAERRRNINHC